MAGERIKVPIADICHVKQGRYLPPGEMAASRTPATSIPVYGANGILGFTDKVMFNEPVSLVTCRGNGCGLLQRTEGRAWISNNAMACSPKGKNDSRYLHYLLFASDFKDVTTGSAQPQITSGHLNRKRILLATNHNEQKAIAAVLGALDDKIELNRRMNATLEAMARALFQSWFVDFDPVRAKAEGRPTAALYEPTAALFPARFQDSELGEIPQGWRVGTVGEAFNVTMGQSPPGESYNEEGNGLPFFQGRRDFGFRFPTRRVFCTAPTRLAKAGDTLVSVRAPVGDINMADEACCVGRGVAAVRHKTGASSFTYHSMANHAEDFERFEAHGTVFGAINKDSFQNLTCIIPPSEITAAYERFAAPMDAEIHLLDHQSRTLTTLRDTLLPKLLSGGVKLSNF